MSSIKQLVLEIHRRSLWQVLGIYAVASWVIYQIVQSLTEGLGLPDWFPALAIVLLLVGLPIVLATAFVQEGAPLVSRRDPTLLPGAEAATPEARSEEGARRLFTWRNAIMGGVLAFALLGVSVSGYMAMRVMGIGPVGSLVAAGVLDPREPIILADFENNTSDSLLAIVVTEAFRIDISQSPFVQVMRPAQVGRVLARMERAPDMPLDLQLAREVAMREGLKAAMGGEIGTAGKSFVISVQLISAETDELLAGFRETADDSSSIMNAIDRLSNKMRERIGESLKTIRRSEPLQKVTTSSLQALRKYTQGVRVSEIGGDEARGITLFEEAIALDTTFAMAYRGLAIGLGNLFQERDRQVEAMTKAYQYRDRLTERERYLTIAQYHTDVTGDRNGAINAFRSLLDVHPNDGTALNNLGVVYADMGEYAEAAELYLRAIDADSANPISHGNAVDMLYALGRLEEVRAILRTLDEKFPGNPFGVYRSAALASAEHEYEAAERHIAGLK
ncbi:MAG: tetratricopeptide repeat protein, partial [Gemmatimonadales bacterium]